MKVKETKVYHLFACLGVQERKDFARFLATHSKQKKVKLRKSLRFLCARSAEIEATDSTVSNEDWWAEVFPDKTFKSGDMGKHQNTLTSDLEAFLVDRKLRKEADAHLACLRKAEQLLLLLGSLQERGQDRLFEQYARKTRKLLTKLLASLPQDGEYFGLRYKFALLVIAHKQKAQQVSPMQDFIAGKQDLDRYYSLNSLYLLLGMGGKMPKEKQHRALFDLECVKTAIRNDSMSNALAEVMLDFLTLREDYGIADWDTLHDQLRAHIGLFPKHIWIDMANYLFNLASKRIGTGQEVFKEAALRFYELIDKAGVLLQLFRESPAHWLNLWMLAVDCHDFDLYRRYLSQHPNYLHPDEKMKVIIKFMGCVENFSQKAYALARDGFFNIYSITLTTEKKIQNAAAIYVLRCDYELMALDDLKDFKIKFRKSIKKTEQKKAGDEGLSPQRITAYMEFFEVIGVLCKIHFNGVNSKNRKQLIALLERVAATPVIISRRWLLEKINALL